MRDKALWATLIHCALIMKMQNASDTNVEDGLSWLTGRKSEKLYAANTTEQALSKFIEEALKNQLPIVCETSSDISAFDELVETDHAYTITGFVPGTGMITMRNPHGANSRRFRLKTDLDHKKFEQLNDGVFKMHVSLFPKYFHLVVRSSF